MTTAEPLLTREQVAEFLNVSETTVRRLVKSGDLKPFRIGRAPRFCPNEVVTFVESTRKRPTSSAAPRQGSAVDHSLRKPAPRRSADRGHLGKSFEEIFGV